MLVLSQFVEQRYAIDLIGASAERVGYLLKDRVADFSGFADAVRRVASGGSALDPAVVAELLGRKRRDDPLAELTPRERDVLELMAQGRSNRGIAEVAGRHPARGRAARHRHLRQARRRRGAGRPPPRAGRAHVPAQLGSRRMTGLRITHIGGPTALIEIGGWRLLTDPTFDPPGQRYNFGWGTASRKLAGPAIAAADLGPIDAVLLSHDHHGDNLDPAGRALLPAAGVVVTTTSGSVRLGGSARGLAAWESTRLEAPGKPAIEVTATPCRHGPPLSHPLVGDVVGFALQWDAQEHGVLWISGDTVLYDGVREVAERLRVDVALLHLGGVQFPVTGPARYTMTAKDAVELCGLIRPRTAIPIHYEGWKHFKQGRDGVERELARAPEDVRARFRWLPIGEPVELAS